MGTTPWIAHGQLMVQELTHQWHACMACWLITVAKLIADLQNRKQFGFHLDQERRGPEVGKGRGTNRLTIAVADPGVLLAKSPAQFELKTKKKVVNLHIPLSAMCDACILSPLF